MKFGNGPENKNGFVAMTHYCVLAVHLAFNVLRSPNPLHTLDAEARARKRAPFGLLHKPLSSVVAQSTQCSTKRSYSS